MLYRHKHFLQQPLFIRLPACDAACRSGVMYVETKKAWWQSVYKQTFDSRALLTTLQYRSVVDTDHRSWWTQFSAVAISSTQFSIVRKTQFQLSYPICIWRPRWGLFHWSFAKLFGVKKLETVSYHTALIGSRRVQSRVTGRQMDGRTDRQTEYDTIR